MHSASVVKALTEWAAHFITHQGTERVIFGGFFKKSCSSCPDFCRHESYLCSGEKLSLGGEGMCVCWEAREGLQVGSWTRRLLGEGDP